MELFNEPNVKPDQRLLKIIVIVSIIALLLAGVFFILFNLLPSKKSKASSKPNIYNCYSYISHSRNQNFFKVCSDGDTILINKGMKVNQACNLLKDKNVIILIDGCELRWTSNNSIYIGKGGKILMKNGGHFISNSGYCSSKSAIYFGDSIYVTCDGKNANFSFDDVNKYGGVSYSGLTVLPVKLISFNAKYDKETVNLDWTTASEINNSHFEVQRSNNKTDWTVVGTVKGNGNSSVIIKYNYSDKVGKLSGEIYYRLKQIDFDGKSEYSSIRVVSLNNTKVNIGKVYPNPANDIIKVNINTEGDYTIRLVDINGKEMLKQEGSSSIETLNIADIPAGIYFVKIENHIINESHRIIIRH
ncbi:MAG: T9SS type A sorting domain-containing protein [Bacteroidia bacterium]|nr:T9SS type A sorting domain-containing protein [Bacteroidia bacterium]